MKLTGEQSSAFEKIKSGVNVFVTGQAGCGKTYLLKHVINWARDHSMKIGVTASTGLAAYLLRGRTIHSFLGIGLGKQPAQSLAESLRKKNKPVYKKLQALDILIIDEMSMINAELLDKISEYLCLIRGCDKAFGGVQVILCGDLCQIKSVNGKYCFQSEVWKKADIEMVMLEQQIRQSNDETFKEILKELRWGICTKDTLKLLKSLKKTVFADGIVPTRLYSLNFDVDQINEREYKTLVDSGVERRVFKTEYSMPAAKIWADSIKIPEQIELCIGAQVMITWNMSTTDGNLVNGSRGVITGFESDGPRVRLVNGQETVINMFKISCDENTMLETTFMPLKLAYAITIHKSQGLTLDAVEIDLGTSIFEYGQAYTALSRAQTLGSVRLVSVKASSFKTHEAVKRFYNIQNLI